MPADFRDPERAIDLDLISCTENTTLTVWEWFGQGDKNHASQAATDVIHSMFEWIDCKGLARMDEFRGDNTLGILSMISWFVARGFYSNGHYG